MTYIPHDSPRPACLGSEHIARTEIAPGFYVSTVGFRCLSGPPTEFETAIGKRRKNGRGIHHHHVCNYETRAQAEVGHMEIVERLTSRATSTGS